MSLSHYYSDAAQAQRIRARQTASAYRSTVDPSADLSARIEAMYRAYPHMAAGEILSFATAGLDPSDPVVQQAADVSLDSKRKGGFFDRVGDVIGGAGKVVGAVAAPIGQALDTALGDIDESLTPTVKGGVRTGFVALETGLQEVQTFIRAAGWAGVRTGEDYGLSGIERLRNFLPDRWDDWSENFSEAFHDAGSSSGREAISAMLRGEDVDLGSGFLPAGRIEESVRERANRLSLTVNNVRFGGPGNPSITPGRAIAAEVAEPGEQQFQIVSGLLDGTVAWFGDPAAAAAGVAKVGRVGNRLGRAGRALADEGLAAAGRELGHAGQFAPVVDRSLQSRAAEGIGDLLDNLTGRVTGANGTRNTVQPDMVERWLTKDGRRVVERMADADFTTIRAATGGKLPAALTVKLADATTPQEVMDILRPALGTELRYAPEFLGFKVRKSNARGVRLLGEMPGAYIDPNDLDGAVEQIDRWMRNARVAPALRNEAVERVARVTNREEIVATLSDVLGKAADDMAERIRPGSAGTVKSRARELTRMYNREVEVAKVYFADEIAENRRAIGVLNNGEGLDLQSPFLLTEYLNSVIPLPDAREIRRATSRLARLVDNPKFEGTVGVLDAVMGVWKRTALMRGAYTVRVIGEEQLRMASSGLDSMFAHPISFISSLLADPDAAHSFVAQRRQLDVLGEHFDEADELHGALNKGWSKWDDGTIYDKNFVMLTPADEGYRRAWAEGVAELSNNPVARQVAAAAGNLDDAKEWFFTQVGRKFRKKMIADQPALATRAGSDAYIETLWEGMMYRTGGDPLLMDVIATGSYGGERIGALSQTGRWKFADGYLAHFDDAIGPEAVKGQRIVTSKGLGEVKEKWDNGVGWIFSHLMTRPTNYLSRSSTFRQRYWERIEEMLPYMDDATRAKALDGAMKANLDGATLKRMRQTAPAANRSVTEIDDADLLAKAYGLDETKKLLYDMTERSQFFDAFRLIFPFGEAWKEVLGRWAKIGMENPRVFRRGQQVITGARGNGFFHKDTNDEEVFTYPFSRQLSKLLIGAPVNLTGRVSGLSLMTEVLPGVGPAVQVPAAALLPDGSEWNWAREFISPYGEQDYSTGFIESFLPGYAKNIRQAFGSGDERLRNNTIMQMYDYLASTGDYDLSDPEQNAAMLDEARSLGSKLFALRGLTQFFSPTSPLPDTLVEGPEGDELLVRREVIADLYRLQDEMGYDEGIAEFVERYGVEMLGAAQGMSKSIAPVLPVSKQASDWVRDNRGIVDDYKLTWGMFAPDDDTEGIDLTEYGRQIAAGDRVPLTVAQRAEMANTRIGRYIYAQAEAKVGDDVTKEEREWLAVVKEKIRADYPGYGKMVTGLPSGADLDKDVIPELRRALADPRLSSALTAEPLRIYLAARDRALAFADEEYGTKLGAQAAAPLREWLIGVAGRLSTDFPAFQGIYDRVFSYEVET